MTTFRLDDFPDPPEGSGFADDIEYPLGVTVEGTVAAVKAKPEKNSISVKFVKDVDGAVQYALWHNLNLGGEWGHIGKQQLIKFYGDKTLIPGDWDDVASGLKGVQVTFKAVRNGDFINAREIKVTKSVADTRSSAGLGSLVGSATTAPAAPAVAPVPVAPVQDAAPQAPVQAAPVSPTPDPF